MSTSQRLVRMHSFAALLMLTGCTGFSAHGGLDVVQQDAARRLGHPVALQPEPGTAHHIQQLLTQPLSVDAAAEIALLQNPALRTRLAELRIAEADLVQAGRLPNPGFSFGRLARGGELEIDRSLKLDLARLLTLPLTREIETGRYAQARLEATRQVIALSTRTRKAWIDAVAATQQLRYREQVLRSAEASAELARRMRTAGNWNALDEARELGFRSDAVVELARARDAQGAAREQLTRLLGLPAEDRGYALPERLPDLPATPITERDVAQSALADRLDVQSARLAAERTARSLGLTQATRFINVFDLGVARNSYNDGSTERGYVISLEVPLFDDGGARLQRAQAVYLQSLERTRATALDAESEVRQSYAAYRNRYEVAGGPVPKSARWPEVTTISRSARCARSSSPPTSRATGPSTATKATTR